MKQSRNFRCVVGSLEGKWFAESLGDARKWRALLFGTSPSGVVSAVVPRPTADTFLRLGPLDNIGPARFAEIESLESAIIDQVRDD